MGKWKLPHLDKSLHMCKSVTSSLFGSNIFNDGPVEWL